MRSYQAITIKHQSNYINVSTHLGWCPFRIVSIRDVAVRNGVHSGLCPFGIVYSSGFQTWCCRASLKNSQSYDASPHFIKL